MIKDFFIRLLLSISLLFVCTIVFIEFIVEFPIFLISFLFFNKEFELIRFAKYVDEKLDELKWQ